jgi:hypothetical protein
MSSSKKRIVICCDGTFDDFGDTIERKEPGSYTSRLCRWLLPPVLFHILWGLRVCAGIKWIEERLLLLLKPKQPPEPFISNISRIATAIKPRAADGTEQMVVYVGGIGGLGTPQSRFEEAVTGNTMGYKIRHVYRVIADNYMEGDDVFLFGYSRGAFTARAVVGFIRWAGIVRKTELEHFDSVWGRYKEGGGRYGLGTAPPWPSDKSAYKNIKIRCVGLFDTVGSLKAPPLLVRSRNDIQTAQLARERNGRFDISLKDDVENVFQALALDERRFDFYPAVLKHAPNGKQRFKQTWFPGVHADMGGRSSSLLTLFPFAWMISKIEEEKLLDLEEEFVRSALQPLVPDDNSSHPIAGLGSPQTILPSDVEIKPSHWIDRHPGIRKLIPSCLLLPCARLAPRNPNVAALSDPEETVEDRPAPLTNSRLVDGDVRQEQTFHWTVIERIRRSTGYWEEGLTGENNDSLSLPATSGRLIRNLQPCDALRKPDPMTPRQIITKQQVEERQDTPTGVDESLYTYFQERATNSAITHAGLPVEMHTST